MSIIRWEPLSDADDLLRQFGRFGLGRWPRFAEEKAKDLEWAPAADVSETDKEYLVKAELPGVRREEVKVTQDDGVLTISGERRFEKQDKGEKTHRVERFYGSFSRSFSLPQDADARAIRAESKDGVLNVHIPKMKVEKPKAIEIKVE